MTTFQFKILTQVKWDTSCCEIYEIGLNLYLNIAKSSGHLNLKKLQWKEKSTKKLNKDNQRCRMASLQDEIEQVPHLRNEIVEGA